MSVPIWLIPLALAAGFLWGWAAHLWWIEPPDGRWTDPDTAPNWGGDSPSYADFMRSRDDAYARDCAAHTHQVDW